MREEIDAAMVFLKRLIEKCESLPSTKVDAFTDCLSAVLADRFRDHWYHERPTRGQGYRCISFSPVEPTDPVLERAAADSGISLQKPLLPIEMTLWVDPNEVCCRIGNIRTNYCTVASMKDGSLDNKAHTVDVTDLIQRAKEMYFKQLNITTTRVNSNSKHGQSIDKLRTWHQPISSSPPSPADNHVHNNNRDNNYQSSPPDSKMNSENNDINNKKFNQNVKKQQKAPHPHQVFNAFSNRQPFGQLDNGQPFIPPDVSVPPPPMNFKPWQAPGAYSPPAKNKNLTSSFRNHGNKNFNYKQAPPKLTNDRFHWQKDIGNAMGS